MDIIWQKLTQMMSFTADIGVYSAPGALVKSEHIKPGVGGTMVYFGSEDCSIEKSRVVAAAGKVISSKFSVGVFGWVAVSEDTEGNMFGLYSKR